MFSLAGRRLRAGHQHLIDIGVGMESSQIDRAAESVDLPLFGELPDVVATLSHRRFLSVAAAVLLWVRLLCALGRCRSWHPASSRHFAFVFMRVCLMSD